MSVFILLTCTSVSRIFKYNKDIFLNMELNQLNQFKIVAETENLTKAAENILFVSQPALSISIKKLEDELGTPLFDREGKKLKLNSAGAMLLEHVNVILNEIEEINSSFDVFKKTDNRNVINIYSSSMTMVRHFSNLLSRSNLGFEVYSKVIKFEELKSKLKNKECDICFSEQMIDDPDVACMPIAVLRVYVSVPDSHPLAKKKSLKWTDLNNQTMLGFDGNVKEPLVQNMNKILKENNIKINYVLVQYDDFIFTSVALSSDYLCFTNNITEKYTPRGSLPGRTMVKVVDEGATSPLYVNYLKKHGLKVEAVREFIHNNYKEIMV